MANFDDPYEILCYVRKTFIEQDETGLCGALFRESLPDRETLFPSLLDFCENDEGRRTNKSEDFADWNFDEGKEATEGDENASKAVAVRGGRRDTPRVFEENEVRRKKMGRSLLSYQLEQYSLSAWTPFIEYSKYDGSYQFRSDTKTFVIFLTMLALEHDFPIEVTILSSAKVSDLIGLTFYKYVSEYHCGNANVKEDVNEYGLFAADDRGEIDWSQPFLDPEEEVESISLEYLALIELSDEYMPKTSLKERCFIAPKSIENDESESKEKLEAVEWFMEGLRTMALLVHETFRVKLIYKKRKVKVVLAISLDILEIEMDLCSEPDKKGVPKGLELPLNFESREIVACEILKRKSRNRSTFRVINHAEDASKTVIYQNKDFECDTETADKIICKLTKVLEIRGSSLRQDYLESLLKGKKEKSRIREIFSSWCR